VIRGTFPSKANNYKAIPVKGKGKLHARLVKSKKVKDFENVMKMQLDQVVPVVGEFIVIGTIYTRTHLKDLDGFKKLFYDVLQAEGKIENDNLLAHHSWSKGLDREAPRVEFYLLPRSKYVVQVSIKPTNKENA